MDHRGLMSTVVIEDQVYVEFLWHRSCYGVEKFAQLPSPMSLVKLPDNLSAGGLQGSKQCGGSVPPVVVSASLHLTRTHRQKRLRAVQSLDLGLHVDTQTQCLILPVKVKPDNVTYLLNEKRIGR